MRTEKKYSVYGHVNITNGKWYVGMTSQNPKHRWNNGKGYENNHPKMWNDIRESDWNTDWIHTVFDTFNNREDALDYEAFLIDMFDTIENGYNISSYGGTSYKRTEETKKKMSESKIGEKHHMYGKHLSEETKKKLSESMIGNHNKPKKSVLQFTKEGELIAEYPSTREAERKTGYSQSSISKCCKGKYKSAGGYIWKYKEG